MNKFKEKYDEMLEGLIQNTTESDDDFESEDEIRDTSALYLDDAGNEYDISHFEDDDEDETVDEEADDDDDDDDDELEERLVKKKVIRGGKRMKKFTTDKKGHKIKMVKGRAKEVRMKPAEIRTRKKAAKKSARKKKGKSTAASTRKRLKSTKKRKGFGA